MGDLIRIWQSGGSVVFSTQFALLRLKVAIARSKEQPLFTSDLTYICFVAIRLSVFTLRQHQNVFIGVKNNIRRTHKIYRHPCRCETWACLRRVMRRSGKKTSSFWAPTVWYNQITGATASLSSPHSEFVNKHRHPLMSQVIGQVWREVVGCRNWPVMRVPQFIALRRNGFVRQILMKLKTSCFEVSSLIPLMFPGDNQSKHTAITH